MSRYWLFAAGAAGGTTLVAGSPLSAPMWAGESCGVVNDVQPAAEIVRDLVQEAEASRTR